MRITWLDDFIAKRSPGNLLLIYLVFLLIGALVLSLLKIIDQKPLSLIFTVALVSATCLATSWAFAVTFGARSKLESVVITALILSLIISPLAPTDFSSFAFPMFACLWAMASKYLIAPNRHHVFNPAAFGVALANLITGHAATWWVGSYRMLPLVLVGGLIIVRKMRCFDLLVSFFLATIGVTLLMSSAGYSWMFTREVLLRSAFSFFAIVMLTEPRTLPYGRRWRVAFGALVGVFFAPATHIGTIRFAPETALMIGNCFAAAAKWMRRRKARQAAISPLSEGSSLAQRSGH